MRFRDTQRERVYKLDRVFQDLAKERCSLQENLSIAYMEEMAKVVFPRKTPSVKDGRGRRKAGGCAKYITMPKWSRNNVIVCHELAHSAMWREHTSRGYQPHGSRYMAFYKQFLIRFGILDAATIDYHARLGGVKIYSEEEQEAA